MDDRDPDGLNMFTGDEKIVLQAKKRFQRAEAWESDARKRFVDDIKFANGDSDNSYQWPWNVQAQRGVGTPAEKPVLTINKTIQHCLMIQNDAKQNKPSVSIHPTGNGSSFESAQIFEGIIRHIEYISNASSAYDRATVFQVQGGIGYFKVETDYSDDNSFDQEIFIRPVPDPLSIYIDCDIKEFDGSDANWAFIFEDMEKYEFLAKFPDFDGILNSAPLGNTDGWSTQDTVRVADYYRRVTKKDKIVTVRDPSTGMVKKVDKLSNLDKFDRALYDADPDKQSRKIEYSEIEQYKIAGDKIIDRTIFPSRYIPIFRVIGTETIIDGRLDRKGHTRGLIDPQRMYNYWSSGATEFVALQSKSPFVGPAAAIEGYEGYWETANNVNHSILPYRHVDDDGQTIPAPERASPPVMAQAYIDGLKIAANEMEMVSGQYQAQMGAPSNERSGKAIAERQRQGDTATYHFIDHLGLAIRFLGKVLIDMIPRVYDTERVVMILSQDGSRKSVQVDPNHLAAHTQTQDPGGPDFDANQVQAVFNPNVGKYDVEADIGPGYATRRQEAWNAFTQIVASSPQLVEKVGDLMFRAADFPMADEIAERLKPELPSPEAFKELQAQFQHLQGVSMDLANKLREAKETNLNRAAQKDVDIYKAITDRMEVLMKGQVTTKDIAVMMHDFMKQEHAATLGTANDALNAEIQGDEAQPPPQGGPGQGAGGDVPAQSGGG
jgi:hypothetical protein